MTSSKRSIISNLSFFILLSGAVVAARQAPLLKTQEAIKEQYIVVLQQNAPLPAVLQSLHEEFNQKVITLNNPIKEYNRVLNGFSISLSKEALAVVRGHPSVKYVEEDGVAYGSETWGLDRINQRDLPLDDSFTPIGNGSGVNVYVLDTGIRTTHEDFEGRAEFVYDAMNYAIGNDGDCQGHGTHCAGTIAGRRYGVAKAAKVYAVRVLGCYNWGSWSAIIDGMDWVASNGIRPAIVSMSLGGIGSRSVDESLRNLHRQGVTAVVAAMNEDMDSCAFSPARAPEAITVGAIQDDDARVYFSNWGACVDIFAPGHRILSADYRSDDGYRLMSGTSMACPHVAGVAAIHLGLNPNLTPDNLRDVILGSASRDKVTNLHDSENLLLYVPSMDWVAVNGIRPAVASMSLGGGGLRSVDESLGNLHRAGVTVVVAAGNSDYDACRASPARAPEAITVGAIQDDDARVYFSNWGACVDIFAPGHRILSADYRSDDGYRSLSGTSMACPHVAGVVAVHLGLNPDLSPNEVRDVILETASRDKVTELHDSENLLLYVPNES